MTTLPTLVAQSTDDGWEWSNLFYLFILIVLPVVNKIKDKFVERSEAKRQEKGAAILPKARRVPKLRPVEPALPIAKALQPRAEPRRPAAPSRAGPPPTRPVGPAPTPPVARPASAARSVPPPVKLPTAEPSARAPQPPRPAPTPAQPVKRIARRRPAEPARIKPRVAERESVAGVNVKAADPRVDVHAADPRLQVRRADPSVKVATSRPAVDVHELVMAEVDDRPATGADILGGQVSAAEMRRAVVLSEILRPPLALRGPGGQPPGAL